VASIRAGSSGSVSLFAGWYDPAENAEQWFLYQGYGPYGTLVAQGGNGTADNNITASWTGATPSSATVAVGAAFAFEAGDYYLLVYGPEVEYYGFPAAQRFEGSLSIKIYNHGAKLFALNDVGMWIQTSPIATDGYNANLPGPPYILPISPDGTKIFLGSGECYDADWEDLLWSCGTDIIDAHWLSNTRVITLHPGGGNGVVLRDAATGTALSSYNFTGSAEGNGTIRGIGLVGSDKILVRATGVTSDCTLIELTITGDTIAKTNGWANGVKFDQILCNNGYEIYLMEGGFPHTSHSPVHWTVENGQTAPSFVETLGSGDSPDWSAFQSYDRTKAFQSWNLSNDIGGYVMRDNTGAATGPFGVMPYATTGWGPPGAVPVVDGRILFSKGLSDSEYWFVEAGTAGIQETWNVPTNVAGQSTSMVFRPGNLTYRHPDDQPPPDCPSAGSGGGSGSGQVGLSGSLKATVATTGQDQNSIGSAYCPPSPLPLCPLPDSTGGSSCSSCDTCCGS
jgi:hypothetical protein